MGAAAGGGRAVPGSGGGVAVAAGGVVVRLGRTNSSLMQCFLVIVTMGDYCAPAIGPRAGCSNHIII